MKIAIKAFSNFKIVANTSEHQNQQHICRASQFNRSSISVFLQFQTINLRPHKCPKCSNAYAHPSAMREHYLAIHENVYKYVCSCGNRFKWGASWRHHLTKCQGSRVEIQDDSKSDKILHIAIHKDRKSGEILRIEHNHININKEKIQDPIVKEIKDTETKSADSGETVKNIAEESLQDTDYQC